MTSISSPSLSNNQAHANAVPKPSANSNAGAASQEDNGHHDSKTTFSSRASRLAKLNEEYDILAPSFTASQQFINRMYNLGLISTDDSETLTSSIQTPEGKREETRTVSEMQTTIYNLSQRLKSLPEQAPFVTLLNNSSEILSNLNASKSNSFPVDPATAAAELEQYINSYSQQLLQTEETESLADIKIALNIADRLSPEKRASAEVSKYMEILSRYG